MKTKLFTILICLTVTLHLQAVTLADTTRVWEAAWITYPQATGDEYGVYYFRKTINLETVPGEFPVRVSADNKYKLFVNGELVSVGPARGDISHWRYETVDLAAFLQQGDNVVAALVWNDGQFRPVANFSYKTGFIIQGLTGQSAVINSDPSWKCKKEEAYEPIRIFLQNYYVTGPGEKVDMGKAEADWNTALCDASDWQNARMLSRGNSLNLPEIPGGTGGVQGWELVPDPLPAMEMTYQRMNALRLAEGCEVPASFPYQKRAITIPANTKATIVLDQGYLTNAYFTLEFSKGKHSVITPVYLESYYNSYPDKGNRDEVEGKVCTIPAGPLKERMKGFMSVDWIGNNLYLGRYDILISSGKDGQKFTTLAYRTYRYVQLDIETKDEPLIIDDVYGTFTGFPFNLKAVLDTDNEEIQRIFETGWRTARLCAVDTYMDCPYYEQLQYLGDTRIQALLSLYNTGDDRLVKNFLNLTDCSRRAEGITQSRYPSALPQIITPFSLWYIGSLYDYMLYGNDLDFLRDKLPGMRIILHYFSKYQTQDGSLLNLPGWNFTDWVIEPKEWNTGVAEKGSDGRSALMDLQLLLGYQHAALLEENIGLKELAAQYNDEADRLIASIQSRYWDSGRGLFSNNSDKDSFSQHANALAILTGLVEGEKATDLAVKMITDNTLDQATIYFSYYVNQALVKAGLGDEYMNRLGVWRENLAMGMTTWAEISDIAHTRSDCHAWGASPNIEFFRILLGIDSADLCFRKVRIEPHLGHICKIGGSMPHPQGMISVSYQVSATGELSATITLPKHVTGTLVWNGSETALHGGVNRLEIK